MIRNGFPMGKRFSTAVAALFVLVGLFASTAVAIELVPAGSVIVTSPSSSARGIALSADEKVLYIGGIQDRSLVKVDIATGALAKADLTAVDPGAYGKSTWVSADGAVWAPLTAPYLAVYSPDLTLKSSWALKQFGITAPEGAAVSANGDIYVTDRNSAKQGIYKFRLDNGQLALVTNWGVNGFVKIPDQRVPVITASGDLMVGAYSNNEIYLVRANDGVATLLTKAVKNPYYLALDAKGMIYVAHYNRKDAGVSICAPDGTVLQSWTLAELGANMEIAGIAVSKDGKRLYVEDQRTATGGKVLIFDIK